MLTMGILADRVATLLYRLGQIPGRRRCCGCGELEGMVGDLLEFAWTLDRRVIRFRRGRPAECTLSRHTSVISRVCTECNRQIHKQRAAMVNLEMRTVYRDDVRVSMLLVEATKGVSLRALPEPQLCLIPPLPEGVPVGAVPGL